MNNNDERNALIERLFATASRLPPEERADYLDKACAGDDEARREVASLLANDLTGDRLLETAAAGKLARVLIENDGVPVGREFDAYFIVRELGRGGMGRVYLAEDLRLKRRLVAVKVLPELFAQNTAWVGRFEREAQAASALNHPNIVTIHATGQSAGLPFIVMEYIEGVTLREHLQAGALAWPEAVRIATQIAGALHAAQQAGIIHRDIKPENVMLRGDGLVKVLDFGIARWKDEGGGMKDEATPFHPSSLRLHPSLTAPGAVIGTPDYLSPEQARGAQVDKRTDIFSFGLVLAEMLTGRHPLAGLSAAEKLAALLSAEELTVMTELPAAIPAALAALVWRAVRKRVDDRYASAEELWEALKELNPPLPGRLAAAQGVKGARRWVRVQQANRLLNQYVALAAQDAGTRLPFSAWWAAWRAAEFKGGKLERALLRKSLWAALGKLAVWAALVAAVTVAVAAFFSIEAKWEERMVRDGHAGPAYQIAFSPDGQRLVSVGQDKQIIVWDFARRERLATLTAHTVAVQTVAFAPNGKWLVTGSDGEVIVWEATSLTLFKVLHNPRRFVANLTFSADNRRLAYFSGEHDRHLMIRAVEDWRVLYDVPLGNASGAFATSADQRRLLNSDGQSWDLTGAVPAGRLQLPASAFSPAGTQLVMAGVAFFGLPRAGDLTTLRELYREPAHNFFARAAAYSPNGLYAATGADDIVLWEAATQKKLGRFAHTDYVWGLAFSPDSRWLVSSHGDGALLLWDVAARRLAANFNEHSGPVTDVAFSADGQKLISASPGDRSVMVWDAQRLRKEAVFPGTARQMWETAISPDGQWVATGEQRGRVKLWNVAQPHAVRTFQFDGDVGCPVVAPGGKWVASNAQAYDGVDGHVIGEIGGGKSRNIAGMSLSADGTRLAAGADGGWLLLWDTANWQLLAEARVPGALMMIRMAFSPDGQRLAVGDTKGEVWLWQVNHLRRLARLGAHKDNVQAVAFAPDGRVVASGSDDQTVALWDVAGRRLITYVGTHAAPVRALAFSPDGKRLVTGEHDNSVRVYTRQRTLWGWRLD